MIKRLSISCLCLLSSVLYAETPVGFLWYNTPKENKPLKSHGIPFKSLSYTDKDAVLKFYTLEALHKVRFTHKLQDERTFLAWQSFWLREATLHGQLNQMALRYYPQYDFSVTHPTSNLGTKLADMSDQRKTNIALKNLAKTYGIFFFYRGKNTFDSAQIPIIQDFCEKHHFALIPITIDGVKSPLLPKTRFNQGQADRLGVHYFPAMLLVNPKENTHIPIAFGVTTQDMLQEKLSAIYRSGI